MDITNKTLRKVALCGKANSGKNTTAKLIADSLCSKEDEYKMIAFADPIKEMIMVMFPWADRDCLYGSSKLRANVIPNATDQDGNPLTYRRALIDLGSQGRAYNPLHWINLFDHAVHKIPFLEIKYDNVNWSIVPWPKIVRQKLILCTDVRFRNEFDYLKSKDYFLIKIKRDSDIVINHSTETNQDSIKEEEFDYVFSNNGTLSDLENEVKTIVDLVKKGKGYV